MKKLLLTLSAAVAAAGCSITRVSTPSGYSVTRADFACWYDVRGLEVVTSNTVFKLGAVTSGNDSNTVNAIESAVSKGVALGIQAGLAGAL